MKRKKLDIQCVYCGRKFNEEEMRDLGFIDETKVGLVYTCMNSKCEQQWLKEDK